MSSIVLKGIMGFDSVLGRMWDWILGPEEVPPLFQPPKTFVDPSGKFMRAHLSEWIDSNLCKEQYHLKVEDHLYHVMYVPLKSTWYTVAYYINRHKVPALGAFIRGKKAQEEMREFIKVERVRKQRENLKTELRQKHPHHRKRLRSI